MLLYRGDKRNSPSCKYLQTEGLLTKSADGGHVWDIGNWGDFLNYIAKHIDEESDEKYRWVSDFFSFTEDRDMALDYAKKNRGASDEIYLVFQLDTNKIECIYQNVDQGIYVYEYKCLRQGWSICADAETNPDGFSSAPMVREPCRLCSDGLMLHRILIIDAVAFFSKRLSIDEEADFLYRIALESKEWLVVPLDPVLSSKGGLRSAVLPLASFWSWE